MIYSNPRMSADFEDWPIGRQDRGKCRFLIQQDPKKGERVSRTTTNKRGAWCKPKTTTYAVQCRIVDGDDDKTYILKNQGGGMISVMQSNLQFQQEVIHDRDPRYADLLKLFDSENNGLWFKGGATTRGVTA